MIQLEKLENASEMLKAIAHPMRIAIVDMLADNKSLTVTEIHEALNIEQAVASHHLSIMKNKGVLISERNGKNSYYKLKHPRLSQIVSCIDKCQQ
ncbi:winged helix-turn-helix transcriptional regulator [Vicingus serpentipes]|jgi:DNA-binding transcriptional ArsR family regulator|uniref:Winged helix-turn-helix transcriptional regulator n=1 Tax=Vicingus serpentipes TaxID=1926625 RepID=A0A5C6RNQ2_9FLAO|nr:metalloregulator ArsR/SmtB family transcription factor [Vicingus serpentipes]TXB63981.1 winged helix-turn-helix transcriptional regulator [Vicingus serpentipes]